MKFLVRWAFRFLILGIVLAVALLLLKDAILKSILEGRVRASTGMDVRIGRFEAGLLTPTINIENLRLFNPAEFGGAPFAVVSDLHVEYDRDALAARRLHFKLVRIHVEEVSLVESAAGRTNLAALLARWPELTSTNFPALRGSGFRFAGIDTLNLTLGKVRNSSLRKAGPPEEINWQLQNQILTNVKSAADIETLLLNVSLQRGLTISNSGRVRIGLPAARKSEPVPPLRR